MTRRNALVRSFRCLSRAHQSSSCQVEALQRSLQAQLQETLTCLSQASSLAPSPQQQFRQVRSFGFAAAAVMQEQVPIQLAPDAQLFRVRVVTGNLRGAGTHSSAVLQLIGSNGATEHVVIGTDDHLDRGSSRTVEILVPRSFGCLRRVHVSKRRDMMVAGDGWYLKHIEVEGPEGERTLFPCNSWLGESDCGGFNGPPERNLLPAVANLADELPVPVKVAASGVSIPHPEKVLKQKMKGHNARGFGYGGEDAYFFAQNSNGLFGMGVADGVYMWREQGIDAGLMSRSLMETCRSQVEAGVEDMYSILHHATAGIQSAKLLGSSTVCLLTINQATGQLHSANLGDSGFLVLTPTQGGSYNLKFRTNQLEHSFGCPYQLGHHDKANKVEDSDLASFHVHPGDVIVMGSDGLLDNLADLDIAKEVGHMKAQGASASVMAQRITKLAFDASMDRRCVTPYSKGASEAFDMVYSGGKPDDITVLVACCV